MNKTTAVFLMNDRVRAIRASYEADPPNGKASTELFKTFDHGIKVGDLINVVSTTRHNVTVCKVQEVDAEFDIETTATIQWVIGKVEMLPHHKTLAMENDALAAIASAEKNRKREELRKSLMADIDGKIDSLPIAAIGHDSNARRPEPPAPAPSPMPADDVF